MKLDCVSDAQKNILIKALEERERVLDTLIEHHAEDVKENEAKGNFDFAKDLQREKESFEKERATVTELVELIDLAPSCGDVDLEVSDSYRVQGVKDMEEKLEEAKRQFTIAGEQATGKKFVDIEAREDRMGYLGIYATTEDGDVYSPYYNQSESWAEDLSIDPDEMFKEEWALIVLAGGSDWGTWDWVKQ